MMDRIQRVSAGVCALLCATFAANCDSNEGDAPVAESRVVVCDYDTFEAEITTGPSAGLRLEGHLMIFRERPTGEFTGLLRQADGSEVFATGALFQSGDISLTFHTEAGYVMGLGRVGDNFCKADATLEGVAIGPKVDGESDIAASDSGHWLLNGPTLLLGDEDDLQFFTPSTPFDLGGDDDGFTFAKVSCPKGSSRLSDSCCKQGVVTICENGAQECSFDYGVSPPTKSCSMDAAIGNVVF